MTKFRLRGLEAFRKNPTTCCDRHKSSAAYGALETVDLPVRHLPSTFDLG